MRKKMSGSSQWLDILIANQVIAHMWVEDNIWHWHYKENWRKGGYAIAPHLYLNKPIDSQQIENFLLNLLPEGNNLAEIAKFHRLSVSNTNALIQLLGHDLTGALTIIPKGNKQKALPNFIPLNEDQINEKISDNTISSLLFWNNITRLSVSGLQSKITVVVDEQGRLGFGESGLGSTHILKFEAQANEHRILNEYISTKLAELVGLNVVDNTILHLGHNNALLVKRFDRKYIGPQQVKRRQIIDGCQALNLPPSLKYEKNLVNNKPHPNAARGASLSALFKLVEHTENPIKTKSMMTDWVIFNIIIANYNAHAKNISFFVSSKGLKLCPFYDLVNMALTNKIKTEFAMSIGNNCDGKAISVLQLTEFCASCNLPIRLVKRKVSIMANKVLNALENLNQLAKNIDELKFVTRYNKVVSLRATHLLKQADLFN